MTELVDRPTAMPAVTDTSAADTPAVQDRAELRVWRGDGTTGQFVDYTVDVNEGEVVLDVVHRLQAEQAGDLAVRWNCKAGKCGSCSMEINGKPRLACMTRMETLPKGEQVTVAPMRAFPVIRDLVTDVSYNYEKMKAVPELTLQPRAEGEVHRMAQEDISRLQEFHKCIECFMCQNVCHVIRDHDENKPAFAGPRVFLKYAELDMHPLSTQHGEKVAYDEGGLGYCNITKCCSEVCPEDIHITDNAIIPMKERIADRKFEPLVWLGDIKRRRKDGK